jgi:hypothetical protein
MARPAVLARQARIVRFDDDPLPDFTIANMLTDSDDVSTAFVTHHPREPWGGAGAVEDAEIRTAEPYSTYRDNDVLGAGIGLRPIIDQFDPAGRGQDDGSHRRRTRYAA